MNVLEEALHEKTLAQMHAAGRVLCHLSDRWRDESEYEDFAGYLEAIKKQLPEGATNVRMTKKPFKVFFDLKDAPGMFIHAQARGYRMTSVPIRESAT